jgi:hypothetical protein
MKQFGCGHREGQQCNYQ